MFLCQRTTADDDEPLFNKNLDNESLLVDNRRCTVTEYYARLVLDLWEWLLLINE